MANVNTAKTIENVTEKRAEAEAKVSATKRVLAVAEKESTDALNALRATESDDEQEFREAREQVIFGRTKVMPTVEQLGKAASAARTKLEKAAEKLGVKMHPTVLEAAEKTATANRQLRGEAGIAAQTLGVGHLRKLTLEGKL